MSEGLVGRSVSRRRSRFDGPTAARAAVLLVGVVLVVVPYLVQVLASGKSLSEINSVPPTLLPQHLHLQNFSDVFDAIPLGQQLLNSAIVTIFRVAGQVTFSAAAAYAFARLDFPGRRIALASVLAVLMVPGQLFVIPLYEIMSSLGWVNTLQALFVPGMFSPFGVFLLYQFFSTLPRELDEAAKLDGANPLVIFVRILLPLAKPGLIAVAVLTAVWSWNDFFWPLIVTNDAGIMPVSVGLSLLNGQYATNYPLLMAGAVVVTLPVIATFAVLQKYFVAGFASSGLK